MTRPRWRGLVPGWAVVAVALLLAGTAVAMYEDDIDVEPIHYTATRPSNPISRLQERLERGQVTLKRDGGRGYLTSVLQQLNVPISSQMLVFSKTSFQREKISPQTPRAVYFNDQTYVGWVQDGIVEVSTADPQLGAVFYILDQRQAKPKFVRQTHECLSCHGSTLTRGVPGHVVRSVFADGTGQPILSAGTFITTDESPLRERWGGWYVTGTHGKQRHMGNLITHSARQAENPDLAAGANVTDLGKKFDTRAYLSRHSDIVALLVLEHQAHIHNLITQANYGTRKALHFERALNKELGRPAGDHSESTLSRIKSVAEPLAQGMLFVREAPLTAPVTGTSTFAREFAARGPRDRQNRSLRDLDLKKRLLKYPCSHLIYSEAFGALPMPARDYVYRRLWQVLNNQDSSAEFAHLSATDRKAILEILVETKPDFAAWQKKSQQTP